VEVIRAKKDALRGERLMILSSLPFSKKSRINSLSHIVDPIGLSPIGATISSSRSMSHEGCGQRQLRPLRHYRTNQPYGVKRERVSARCYNQ